MLTQISIAISAVVVILLFLVALSLSIVGIGFVNADPRYLIFKLRLEPIFLLLLGLTMRFPSSGLSLEIRATVLQHERGHQYSLE
jgi:hypothetical protein